MSPMSRHQQEDQWPRLHQKSITSAHEKLGELMVAHDKFVEGQIKLLEELRKEINDDIAHTRFYDGVAEAEVMNDNDNAMMNSQCEDMLEGYETLTQRFTIDLQAYQFRLAALKIDFKKHASFHESGAMRALAEFKDRTVEGHYYVEDFDFEPLRQMFRNPDN